ncbi:uncharacterized protein LOC124660413 [Lolium rigidum]|uniref:uncharacterized protein LOC124660413 n=1 Tax=Lolium rigidum TaxID=89674 RepID=UPI001F5D85A9|nr:uncharacterized protein LOC124660413 [Lolium rigidum]
MVRWSQITWWTCGQGTTPATLASGGSSALAVICSISFCSSSSSNDDDKLDKPMTEAMDGLYGEAPLEEHVVNGINTRFNCCVALTLQWCQSMSVQKEAFINGFTGTEGGIVEQLLTSVQAILRRMTQ